MAQALQAQGNYTNQLYRQCRPLHGALSMEYLWMRGGGCVGETLLSHRTKEDPQSGQFGNQTKVAKLDHVNQAI